MSRDGRRWKRRGAIAVTTLAILAAGAFWYLRGRNSPPIAAAGGVSFTNFTAIPTPFYRQRDVRWKDDVIGSGETLAKVGCTVSSLAMALEHYGVPFTPGALNDALKRNEGYTSRGWLRWNAVQKISAGKVAVRIVGKPTHTDIDGALHSHNPVLVKVFINHVIPHWVLLVGKEGREYLMRDPLDESERLKRLSEYKSDIFGVRIVEPISLNGIIE